MSGSFEYLDKQTRDAAQRLHQASKDEGKNNWKTIILDGSRLRGGQHLFPEKIAAQQHFIKEINALIDRSYDNYRYKASDKSNHVFCGVFNKMTKDLLGLMVLLKKISVERNIASLAYPWLTNDIEGKAFKPLLQKKCRTTR